MNMPYIRPIIKKSITKQWRPAITKLITEKISTVVFRFIHHPQYNNCYFWLLIVYLLLFIFIFILNSHMFVKQNILFSIYFNLSAIITLVLNTYIYILYLCLFLYIFLC